VTEQTLRDRLRDAAAAEPPMRWEPDEIVTRARRQRGRRRVLMGTVAATAAVAVAGTTLAAQVQEDEEVPQAPGGVRETVPPTPVPLWPFPPEDGTYAHDQYEDAAATGRERLREAFEALTPEVTVEDGISPNQESYQRGEPVQYWMYTLEFTTGAGTGAGSGAGTDPVTYEAKLLAYVDANGEDDASTCEGTSFENCDTFRVLNGRGQGLYGFEPGDPESRVEIKTGDGELAWLIVDGTSDEPTPLSQRQMTDLVVDVLR
jgi:hypothetical protein